MLVGSQFVFLSLPGCGGIISGPSPLVSGSKPGSGNTNVPPNQAISVTFSENMNPDSVNTTSFSVSKGGVPVSGTVGLEGAEATFTPDVPLEANTIYTVTITTGVTDLAGNPMSSDRTWIFTTGTASDVTPPSVTLTNPKDGDADVALDTVISVTFSEAVNSATITGATFTVSGVVGTVTLSGTTATFRPSIDLAPETTYTATISTGVTDLAGIPLSQIHTWRFTTGATVDVDPPVVNSTVPAAGASGISVNGIISVTFNEPIDPATITTNTFTVNNGVIGTISLSGSAAIFTPNTNLAFSTTYTATISSNVRDLAGNAMGVPHTWSFTTGATPDTTPPTVVSTGPVNGESGVVLGATLTAIFSEGMDPTTITSATFTINNGVGGTVAFSGTTATFTPNSALTPSTTYTATITTGATDLAGNAMSGPQAWSFTTEAGPDVVPPSVISTVPINGANGISVNTTVSASFSEPVAPETMTISNFTLLQGVTPVPGMVSLDPSGSTAVFSPGANLEFSTSYTATVTTGVTDLAGNPVVSNHTWSFTTGVAPDTTPPTVISRNPENGQTSVALDVTLSALFSEAMDPTTITSATFSVDNGVTGTVSFSGTTATFVPGVALAPLVTYTAIITTGVSDAAGNAMVSNHTWSFTTRAAPDTTPPTVVSTNPADNAIDVAVTGNISVTLSEPMDPSTITTTTFLLSDGVSPVTGTVVLDPPGTTATFLPSANLTEDTLYTATITTGVMDMAGNPLSTNQTWTFRTGIIPDLTPPTVDATSPADGVVGVLISSTISATFSEPMDPASISATTFTIDNGVSGSVSLDPAGTTVTFIPNANLSHSITYTATISASVRDLAGNILGAIHTWTFTTVPDTTAPTVVSTDPVNGEPGVAVNRSITITFSEPMDPASITAATFSLSNGVTGSVTLTGTTATFTPSTDLASLTSYTATIMGGVTGVKDLAGNALLANHAWTFTTGTAPDLTTPTVVSTNPATTTPSPVGVAINIVVSVTFIEPIDPATVTGTTFTLNDGVAGVTGAIAVTGATATFTPSADLAISTSYTATIAGTVADISGNPLGISHIWTFTTGGDTISPTVTTFFPVDDAVDVAVTVPITATFNEPIDPATMNTSTFFILPKGGAVIVAGAVTLDTAGTTATLIPDLPLSLNTEYRVTISKTVTDLSGNLLGGGLEDFNWKFNTIP